MSSLTIPALFILFEIVSGTTISKTTAPNTWQGSIDYCKQYRKQVLVPLDAVHQDLLIADVTNTAMQLWTSLYQPENSAELKWKGLSFFEELPLSVLPWKPGGRPAGGSNSSCVAMEVTRLSVQFYTENCSKELFSYCNVTQTHHIFSLQESPPIHENSSLPFLELGSVVNYKTCSYECLETGVCVTFSYNTTTETCQLFRDNAALTSENHVWSVTECTPLSLPDNSQSSVDIVSEVYASFNLSCQSPYTPVTAIIECQKNGQWTSAPSCILDVRDCPDGHVSHEGICYLFSEKPMTWHDALLECEDRGGRLLEIRDQETMDTVDKLLFDRTDETFWIGASDEIQTNWFHWSTQYKRASFYKWHTVSSDPSGHCVQLKRVWGSTDLGSFFFDARECSEETNFICQIGRLHVKDSACLANSWCKGRSMCFDGTCRCISPYSKQIGSDTDSATECQRGWSTHLGFSLSDLGESLSRSLAEKACRREGGNLLAPVTDSWNSALTVFYTRQDRLQAVYYWTSLEVFGSQVVDNGVVEFNRLEHDYLPWKKGVASHGVGNCVRMEISKAGVNWLKVNCGGKQPVLCSKFNVPFRATLEANTEVSVEAMLVLWTKTSDWCGAECLSRTDCTSFGYTNHTCRLFNDTSIPGPPLAMDYWTRSGCSPLTSVAAGSVTAGEDGDVTYECDVNYHPGTNEIVECLNSTLWSLIPVCVPDGPACPDQWIRHGTSCYMMVKQNQNWMQAAETCEELNGYLVEINSESERQFLVNFLDYDKNLVVWTGGNDIGLQNWYRWRRYPFTDITVLDWYMDEPTVLTPPISVSQYQDCIELRKRFDNDYAERHYYSDINCEETHPFLCEKKVYNVGSTGCSVYAGGQDFPCNSVAECDDDVCQCPFDTYRQTGISGLNNATCDLIQPVGGTGCMSRDELCFNVSVCTETDECECPMSLYQNGQDNSYATACEAELPGCTDDWRGYGDKCYKMFSGVTNTDTELSRDQECVKMGGTLASVYDQQLNDFLLVLGVRANKWISLHGREGQLKWADGSVIDMVTDFTNFRSSGSTLSINDTCVYLSMQGTWVREACSTGTPQDYICANPKLCHIPPVVPHATANVTDEFVPVGTTCTYTCEAGFVIEGTHTGEITCRATTASSATSIWGLPPVCVSLESDIFGSASEIYGKPSEAALFAPDEQTCGMLCYDRGDSCTAFSYDSPSCQLYTSLSSFIQLDFLPLPTPWTVKKRKACPPLPVVKNAEMIASDRHLGSTASFVCSARARLAASSKDTVTCQDNGFWEEMPVCQDRFERYSVDVGESFLNTYSKKYYHIPSLDTCENRCIDERAFRCLSLRYAYGECFLFSDRLRALPRHSKAVPSSYAVYSELTVSDLNEFHTLFNTRMTVSAASTLQLKSMEQCAQACLLSTAFECLTVTYNLNTHECSLYAVAPEQGINMVQMNNTYLFRRNVGCEVPAVIPGTVYSVVSRKVPDRYNIGDRLQVLCMNTSQDFMGDNQEGFVDCQQGGKWTRAPVCRNLCEAGWSYQNGYCYKLFDTQETFPEALTDCLDVNASLVTIQHEYELSYINKIREDSGSSASVFWLGVFSDLGGWRWVNGLSGNLSVRGPILPSPAIDTALTLTLPEELLLAASKQTPAAYVCKKALPELMCPDGWNYFNQTCYNVSSTATVESYDDAEAACESQGYLLTTPHDHQTEDFIKHIITQSGVTDPAFTGLKRAVGEDWVYVDGSTIDWKYATGSPDPSLDETCYLIGPESASLNTCTGIRPYVCQAPLSEVGVAADYSGISCVTDDQCGDTGFKCMTSMDGESVLSATCRHPACPSSMLYNKGRCFHVSENTASYVEATVACGKLGGKVVSVSSMEDNVLWLEILERYYNVTRGFWIGYDSMLTSTYMKTSALDTGFSSWGQDEPNSLYSCTVSSSRLDGTAKWRSIDCLQERFHYICEVGVQVSMSTNQAYYEGCFSASVTPFSSLSRYKKSSSDMDVSSCRHHCDGLGYKYAALKGRTLCSCGDVLDLVQRVTESKCTYPCAGKIAEICGGASFFSVYKVKGDVCSSAMPTDPSHPSTCYSRSIHSVKWHEARFSCGRNGGDLVSISSLQQQKFLFENVFTEPGSYISPAHIGVYQGYSDGKFNYYAVDNSTLNWRYFFSDGIQGIPDETSLDHVVSDAYTGEWIHKAGSTHKTNYICQYTRTHRAPASGYLWRRALFSRVNTIVESVVDVSTDPEFQDDAATAFNSNTKLYSYDFDLGCLNSRHLCPEGFTLMFWVFINSSTSSDLEILSTGKCQSLYYTGQGFCMYYSHLSSELVINDASNSTVNKQVKIPITTNQKHLLAVVFDGRISVFVYHNGITASELTADSAEVSPYFSGYRSVRFGNWHGVTKEGSQFELHDVRFKPQKMMWFEISSLYGNLHVEIVEGTSDWLETDLSLVQTYGVSPDPGRDGSGLRFSQQGSMAILSDKMTTCANRLDLCTGDFTFSFWIQVSAVVQRPWHLLTVGDVAGGKQGLEVKVVGTDVHVNLILGSESFSFETSGTSFSLDQWHHLAIVYSQMVGLQWYKDAVLVATVSPNGSGTSSVAPVSALVLGHVACPLGWVHSGASCYFLEKNAASFWYHVKKARTHGAHLVHVDSDDEYEFLQNFMSSNGATATLLGIYNESPAPPHQYFRVPGGLETYFTNLSGDKYQELNCAGPLCSVQGQAGPQVTVYELDIMQTEFPVQNACSEGWHYYQGSCYKQLGRTVLSAVDAVERCAAFWAYPVVVDTQEELRFVANITYSEQLTPDTSCTIAGISREIVPNGNASFLLGDWRVPAWDSWHYKPPGDKNCLKLKCEAGGCFYEDVSCTDPVAYVVCEKPAARTCGIGWKESGGQCYYKYSTGTIVNTNFCQQNGYTAIVVEDVSHMERLRQDLDLDDVACLTDATLIGTSYTWMSTGRVTYFDKNIMIKSEACISLSAQGFIPKCNTTCIICQQVTDDTPNFAVDNLKFHEKALSVDDMNEEMADAYSNSLEMTCSVSPSVVVSPSTISCTLINDTLPADVTLSVIGGEVRVVHDPLGEDAVKLGDGVRLLASLADVTQWRLGFTVALWVLVEEDSETILVDSRQGGDSGVTIEVINRTLFTKVSEPNFDWSLLSWLPIKDWTYVVLTWQELSGMSLYINAELVSRNESKTPRPGFTVKANSSSKITLAQLAAGSRVLMKKVTYTNSVWSERKIVITYDASKIRYRLNFDQEYVDVYHNIHLTLNKSLTSFVWRNSLFTNALHVNNTPATTGYPAAVSTGQMKNCFTRQDSCKSPFTISLWLRPIAFTSIQTYITAYTPSSLGADITPSWELIYNNTVDMFQLAMYLGKLKHMFLFEMTFLSWNHIVVTRDNSVKLYVDGTEQQQVDVSHDGNHLDPVQPYSYLEIGTEGVFEIDELQFFGKIKQSHEFYTMSSCHEYYLAGFHGFRDLQVSTDGVDATVQCQLDTFQEEGFSIVKHGRDGNQTVSGSSTTISFTYTVSDSHLQALRENSLTCTQTAAYYCTGSGLFNNPGELTSQWTSLDGSIHEYWAGGGQGDIIHSCACHLAGSCDNGALCNCDSGLNDGQTRLDEGNFTQRQHLPVMAVTIAGSAGGSAVLRIGDLICGSIGYDGIHFKMEEDDIITHMSKGVNLNFITPAAASYTEGRDGRSLNVMNTGFSLQGINSGCLRNISRCRFGFSFFLWLMIKDIPDTSEWLQILELGGSPTDDQEGVSIRCLTGDGDLLSCTAVSALDGKVWTVHYSIQKLRWVHLGLTLNPHLGMNVFLNGHNIVDLGANATVDRNMTLEAVTEHDVRIGYSAAADGVGTWTLDDLWLLDRDVSAGEVRTHFGHHAECGEGWVYSSITGLCYIMTTTTVQWTHQQAEDYCNSQGGTLAIEPDGHFHDWLVVNVLEPGNFLTYLHVGLIKTGATGSYRWSDGKRAEHLPTDLPESPAVSEHCIVLEQMTWRHMSVDCKYAVGALCQRQSFWLPNKEASVGVENPMYGYKVIPLEIDTAAVEGTVGTTANFSLNYAVDHFTDECLSNIQYCHNGWSLSSWLYLNPKRNYTARDIILYAKAPNSDFGIEVFGNFDDQFYFLNVIVNDCKNHTSVKFETSTYFWIHLYVSISISSNITIYFNGMNNTYIENVGNESTCLLPPAGTTIPMSVGATSDGEEQMQGQVDELEVFEHKLLNATRLYDQVSGYLSSGIMELNFMFNNNLELDVTTERLPGKFGYALYLQADRPVSHQGQFAFSCFGCFDMCPDGFTMIMWIQPQTNESSPSFGIVSAVNEHSGFMITYHAVHPVYSNWFGSYWLTLRTRDKQYDFPFFMNDWFWSHVLVTWRGGLPFLFINGYQSTEYELSDLTGDSYPVVLFHLGKADDRVTSLEGFSGGIDEFLFWQKSVTNEDAYKLYIQTIYVENPYSWTSDAVGGTSLTDVTEYLNLTAEIPQGTCYLQGESCAHGMTFSVIFRFLGLNDFDQIIVTTGGNMEDGTGLYFRLVSTNVSMPFRRYFNIGVKTLHHTYSVYFNLRPDARTHVVAVFQPQVSLKVYVDKIIAGEDPGSPRVVAASGGTRRLLVGRGSWELKENPNFEIVKMNLWDKAANASKEGQVEDWMHFVHREMNRSSSYLQEGVSLPDCYWLCEQDNITECKSFSFCPHIDRGNCYMLPSQATVADMEYTDKCDAFIPVKLPYIDYFEGCISGSAISGLSKVGDVTIWEQCRILCHEHGSQYSGIFNGTACYCDDMLGNETLVPSSNCDIDCSTIDSETCGGSDAVSVYSTGTLAQFISPQIAVDTLLVAAEPGMILRIGDNITLRMDINPGTHAGFLISSLALTEDMFTGFNTTTVTVVNPGKFTFKVRAMNEISFKDHITYVFVFKPLSDIDIDLEEAVATLSDFHLTLTITNGTNITCEVDYDDSVMDNLFKLDDSQAFEFVHSYSVPAVYYVNITCSNPVSSVTKIKKIIAQDGITSLTFSVLNNPVRYPSGISSVWSQDSGTNVTFRVILDGTDTNLENYDFGNLNGSAAIPQLVYNWTGEHGISLFAHNLISDAYINSSVMIEVPVSGVSVATNGTYHAVNSSVRFDITVDQGSNLTINLWLDEVDFVKLVPANIGFGHSIEYIHTYITPGEKTVNLTVANIHGTISSACTVVAEVSVNDVHITAEDIFNPVDYELDVTFAVNAAGYEPTEAVIDIDFGDASQISKEKADFMDLLKIIHHKYNTHGVFSVIISIYNNVGSKYFSRDVKVGGPIANFTVNMNRLYVPFESPLITTANVEYGSLITYSYDFGDGTAFTHDFQKSYPTAEDIVEHVYNDTVTYDVSVKAINTFNSELQFFQVCVQKKVQGLILTSNSPARIKTDMTLSLTMVSAGTDTCFVFDFNDGTRKVYGVPSCKSRPEYQGLEFEARSDVPLVVSHVYHLQNIYNVTVNSSNEVSWDVVSLTVTALEFICIEPEVEILGLSKNSASPMTVKRSDRTMISANIDTQCIPPVNTVYTWLVEQVSVSGNFSNQTIDIIKVIPLPANGLPSVTIPTNYLEYGTYKISLHVSYEKGSPLQTTDYSYITVTSSSLVGKIVGESFRTAYEGDDLVLDASESHDPDYIGGTKNGLEYKWLCRMENESLSLDSDGIPLSNLSYGISECFSNITEYNTSDSTLVIPSSVVLPAQVYVFGLVISKGERFTYKEQKVWTVNTPVTPVTISCSDNCAVKTIPNQPLRLLSFCSTCSHQEEWELPYLWQLFVVHDNGSYEEVNMEPWTSADISDNSTHNNSTESVSDAQNSDGQQSGESAPNLLLRPGAFHPGVDYRIRLTSAFFVTEKKLLINYPPYGGSCYANRQLGMEFETKFVFHCEDWLDEGTRLIPDPEVDSQYEEPITFKFAYKIQGLNSDPHVFYEVTGTSVHTPEVLLPSGKPDEDHTVDIFVTVADSSGTSSVTLLSVKVIPGSGLITAVYDSTNYLRFIAEKDVAALLLINMGVIEKLDEMENSANSSFKVTAQMRANVLSKIAEHSDWVEAPAQVELLVDILQNILIEPTELSANTRSKALLVFSTMFGALDNIFSGSTDSVTQQKVATGFMQSFLELMLANTQNSPCRTSECDDTSALGEETLALFESRDVLVRMLLNGAVPGETPIIISSADGELTYQLQRSMASQLDGSSLGLDAGKQVASFPDIAEDLLSVGARSLDVEVMESGALQSDLGNAVQTRTTSLSLYKRGQELRVMSLAQPVSVLVYPTTPIPTVTVDVAENFTGQPYYIRITLERTDVTLAVKFEPEDQSNATFSYSVAYGSVPGDEVTMNGTLPLVDESEADRVWMLRFNVSMFTSFSKSNTGDAEEADAVYIGLRPLHDINVTSSVLNMTIYAAGCQYWDLSTKSWRNEGLSFGKNTDTTQVECLTTHLTTFGASFFVPPNTINFQTVFSKFSDLASNAAIFSTIIVIIGLYLLALMFVRRADQRDIEKWSVLPLADNLPSDVYHYQLTVFTGMRRNAGTSSKAYFVLGGEYGDTEIRCVEDRKNRKLSRGSVNTYILSVPQSLGPLLFVRIWHDNSGKGAHSDWYLHMLIIKDIQTDERSVFMCDRWLAVDKDDGQVERLLAVSTKKELESFGHLFSLNSRQDFSDGHLWFSVVSRPTYSNFTRVQRLSCCLSLLLTTMVANAMWYGTSSSEGTQDVHLGPFTFSPQELITSLMMSLIVVPVNLLIVTLFRKAGRKQSKKVKKAAEANYKETSYPDSSRMSSIFTLSNIPEKPNYQAPKVKKRNCQLPHWVVYIAWLLVAVSILGPAFFTILYSMEWGADKSSRWLTSFLLSFVESVILVQPIKVLAVAFVLSLIFRKMDLAEDAPADGQGEITLYSELDHPNYSSYSSPLMPAHRRPYVEKPPDFSTIDDVRTYRKKQNRMFDILKEIGSYIFYLVVISIICYENRDKNSYNMVENMRNLLISDIHRSGQSILTGFEGISTFESFWMWSTERLIPALYLQEKINGEGLPSSHMSWLSDRVHFKVGPPRLRQARAEWNSCVAPSPLERVIPVCIAEYGVINYDDNNYDIGWTKLNTSLITNTPTPWTYQSFNQLNGIPVVGDFASYGGGGYVATLGESNTSALEILNSLKENRWLDRQTRGVFVEINVYNPNVNLFGIMSLLLEVPPMGSAITYSWITPIRLYRYVGPSALFMIITDIIFVAFTIYFIWRLLRDVKTRGRKFLKDFWNFVECLNVVSAILCCSFYGVHYIITFVTLKSLKDHPGEFVNFQRIVLWDEVYSFMLGFLLFFSMMKLLKLIRFNPKIIQLSTSLKKSTRPIFNFFIMFTIVFLAFAQFGYVVFGPLSGEYYSFLTSIETLFSMLLMKVNIEDLIMANSVLGPMFLFLFIIVVVFVLLNMLLSILNEVFTQVKLNKSCIPDDPQMVAFILGELKRVVHFNTGTGKKLKEKRKGSDKGQHPRAGGVQPPSLGVERWLAAEKDLDGFSLQSLNVEDLERPVPPDATKLTLNNTDLRTYLGLGMKPRISN